MKLILRPTIEFDNEKKTQSRYDEWDCRELVHFIALLMRPNQGNNKCFWRWWGATYCKYDKLAHAASVVFYRVDVT